MEIKQSPKDGKFYQKNSDGSWSPVIKVSPKDGKSYAQVGKNQWEELQNEQAQQNPTDIINPLNFVSQNSNAILNTLDLERRYASPAAALAAARPDLLQESERGSGFGEGAGQFPSMAELLNRRAAKLGETQSERSMNQPMRQAGGFLADLVTPSTVLSMGGSKLLQNSPKLAKAARVYEGAANPLGELFASAKPALEAGGSALYNRPFKKIDASADVQKGVQRISEMAKEYGITGDYQQILAQLRDKIEQEGQNIGGTVSKLQGRLSPSEIMGSAEGAASKNLGSMQDRENILNFIQNELDLMTPPSFQENMAKYVADKNKYNADILKYNEQNLGQGRLFDQPQTEVFNESVPVTTETRNSKVIGGDFENFPQSTMGTVEVRNPETRVWEPDIRDPNLQRQKSALENIGTVKIAEQDYKGPTLMGEGAPKTYLPVGDANNYSPRPQVVEQVEQATQQVPLATKSARDVDPQLGFLEPQAPMAAPIEPNMPDQGIFNFSDLFNLKKSTAKKGFRGVPDKRTGAPTVVSDEQVAEIYGAYDNMIKNQVGKELGPEEAKKLAESIDKYAQSYKNKKGFTALSNLAEKEAATPGWGLKSVDLSRPGTWIDLYPNAWTPGAGAQTKAGMKMMKAGEALSPWMIKTSKAAGKMIPPYLVNEGYEQ